MSEFQSNLSKIVNYNLWANERLITNLELIDDQCYLKERQGSFASIHTICAHMLDAQLIWMWRIRNGKIPTSYHNSSQLTRSEPTTNLLVSSAEYISLISSSMESDFKEPIAYANSKGNSYQQSLEDILIHVVNHGTYHRGQS